MRQLRQPCAAVYQQVLLHTNLAFILLPFSHLHPLTSHPLPSRPLTSSSLASVSLANRQ